MKIVCYFTLVLHHMRELFTFECGLLALGGAALGDPYKSRYMKIGEDITITCQMFYNKSTLGVAPSLFDFSELEPKASNLVSKGCQFPK